jgi:DNA polymerase III epsilon subunit-like protein
MALFIDTETTGLPDTRNLRGGVYPDYKDIDKYANARIVQFSILITDTKFKYVDVKDYVIKREGFDITNGSFHGITNEMSDSIGVDFNTIVEDIFYELLKKTTHIVAHNVGFDVGVIKSELHRRNLQHIIDELDKKTLLCTMKHMKPILKIINPYGNYKNPSLNEIYKYNFKKDVENAHNSLYDVKNLHEVVEHMYKNKTLKYEIEKHPVLPPARSVAKPANVASTVASADASTDASADASIDTKP